VNSRRLFGLNPEVLKEAYGCKNLRVLEHKKGLGDVDEVIKPLPGKKMLTNVKAYAEDLKSWGYEVIELPALSQTYRTYINALVVGGTVFMPAYGVPEDEIASRAYAKLGSKVVPVRSNRLSDDYHGSIHCQTMAYPDMDLQTLLSGLGWREAARP
jgi:agmatine/peptidylarginine deiminase